MTDPDLKLVQRMTSKREQVEQEWKESIANARMQGYSFRAIAECAGVSHPRIHAIVNEMMAGTYRN